MLFWFIKKKFPILYSRLGMGLLSVVIMMGMILVGSYSALVIIQSRNSGFEARATAQNAEQVIQAIRNYQRHHLGAAPKFLDQLYQNVGEKECSSYLDEKKDSVLSLKGWCGPYLDEMFVGFREELFDGWGVDFKWESSSLTLTSCGPDGACRNSDDLIFKP